MKYLFTLLMACLPFSFTHGIKSHPSFLNSSGRWVVWSEKPAASWQDAFVTGIALLIAAMSAEGISRIHNIEQIDRGYQNIEGRLNAIGARITRI